MDDTSVYSNYHYLILCVYRASEVLKNLQVWLSCKCSTLNEDEILSMWSLILSKGACFRQEDFFSRITDAKYLGLITDENLT